LHCGTSFFHFVFLYNNDSHAFEFLHYLGCHTRDRNWLLFADAWVHLLFLVGSMLLIGLVFWVYWNITQITKKVHLSSQVNKRKWKGQLKRMDNPEKLATLGTQDIRERQTTFISMKHLMAYHYYIYDFSNRYFCWLLICTVVHHFSILYTYKIMILMPSNFCIIWGVIQTKPMSNIDPTKNKRWTQAPAKNNQFLSLVWHPR
jgi:hypothetical protein